MKYILTILIAFITLQFANAQEIGVFEKPLNCNPFLIEKTYKEEAAKEARLKATELNDEAELRGGGNGNFQDTIYIVSGEKFLIKVDTFGIGADTMIVGTPTMKYSTAKSTYSKVDLVANPNVTLGKDTLQLFFRLGQKYIDTLCYYIVVKRADAKIFTQQTLLKAEKDSVVCFSFKNMTGKVLSTSILDCDGVSIAREVRKNKSFIDSCLYYGASRLGGRDTVCVKVCDENEVCDTHIFPFKVLQDTLNQAKSIVFMDDFSYNQGFPDKNTWLDDRVYVNNTMSSLPVSIGMATFDGLNYTGKPYGFGAGVSDILTSAYLDFEGRTKMYLSFYAEEKGLGYGPSKEDYFAVEFKDKNDRWKEQKNDTIQGKLLKIDAPSPGFKFKALEIPNEYMYKGFQFRFVARSSRTGINDVWNLDYVRISDTEPFKLDSTKKKQALPFADIAFVNEPPKILLNYTAMPWQQFKGFETKELNPSLSYTLNSQFGNTENITDSNISIKEKNSNASILNGYSLTNKFNITPGYIAENQLFTGSQKTDFEQKIQQLGASTDMTFVSEYSYKLTAEQNKNYKSVSRNDTTRSTTRISNFYAYDDGTPESVVEAKGVGTQISVRFNTNANDLLRGVFINFPHFNGNTSNQKFNLRVFIGTLGDNPVYEKLFLSPIYNDKTINGFTYYELTDGQGKATPLNVPKGDFYIGWQQVTSTTDAIVVGLDKNNPIAGNKVYKNTNGIWAPSKLKGAALIRPVFDKTGLITKAEETQSLSFEIYPNPVSNELIVNNLSNNNDNISYQIFDLSGKSLQSDKLTSSINVENLINGVYLLRLSGNGKSLMKKFVVLK